MTLLTADILTADLKRLYHYWESRKGTRLLPSRADIDPVDMRPYLRHVFLMDVVPPTGPGAHRFRFRLAGTEVVERFGEELTGRFLDEVDLNSVGDAILGQYAKAVDTGLPVHGLWEYTKNSGRFMSYERIILPLSTDGTAVDMLLCGACVVKCDRGPKRSRTTPLARVA